MSSNPADDLDVALVADHLAGALDPARSQALDALLAADPAAARRYAGFARTLEGVSELLAAEPEPPLPDDVLRRLDAAFHREVDAAAERAAAVRRLRPTRRRSLAGRSFGGWAAGLVGVAALAGVVAVVVHGGGAGSSSTSSAASASIATAAAPAAAPVAGSAAGSGSSGTALAAPSAEAAPALSPQLGNQPLAVTAANLPSIVRAVAPRAAFTPSLKSGAAVSPAPALTAFSGTVTVSLSCRPAGVARSVPLLAARTVRFAGQPAVLLVLAGPTDRSGTVRATVVAACGGPALLSEQVAAAG